MKFGISPQGFIRIAQEYEEDIEQVEEELIEPVEMSVQDFKNYLIDKYGVSLQLAESGSGSGLVLDKIVVPEDERGGGIGTQVMEEIIYYADTHGLTIGLDPDTSFGGTMGRLKNFYKGFGFVPNKGRNKDYEFMQSYIRQPV